MKDQQYKLDRTAFKALSFDEADKEIKYGQNSSLHERINHFNYLMSIAFRFPLNEWPKMDRSFFQKRNRQ